MTKFSSNFTSNLENFEAPSLPILNVPSFYVSYPNTASKWKYESRRHAQQITPYLYLGPLSAAKDESFLIAANISQVIAVATPQSVPLLKIRSPLPDIKYQLCVLENPLFYTKIFPIVREMINNARSSGSKTLLYCESGNDRSATAAVAYCMEENGWDIISAIHFLQSKRMSISLSDVAKFQLQSYEPIYKAKNDISFSTSNINTTIYNQDNSSNYNNNRTSKRRTIEEVNNYERAEYQQKRSGSYDVYSNNNDNK